MMRARHSLATDGPVSQHRVRGQRSKRCCDEVQLEALAGNQRDGYSQSLSVLEITFHPLVSFDISAFDSYA